MALTYNCPKCNAKLENKASYFWLGPIGRFAFPAFVCPTHGEISISDFPDDIRQSINKQRLIFGIIFFALIVLVIYLGFSGNW